MATIATLAVNLTANTSSFVTGMKSAGGALGNLAGKLGKFAGAGIAAGAAGLAAMAKSAINTGDRIQKLAIQTGNSTEFLSEMASAAELSGTSLETLANGIFKAGRAAFEAQNGNKAYAEAFRRLNIQADQFVKLHPDEQFDTLVTALGKVTSPTERAAIGFQIMGRNFKELAPLIDAGAEGIAKFREQARAAGQSLSREEADQFAAFNDAVTNLKTALAGLGTEIAKELAGPLTKVVDFITTKVRPAFEFLSGIFKLIGTGLGGGAALAVQALSGNFAGARAGLSDLIADLGSQAGATGGAFNRLTAAAPVETEPNKAEEATAAATVETNNLLKQIIRNSRTGRDVALTAQ